MLNEGKNKQDIPNNQTDKLEVPDNKNKEEEEGCKTPIPEYIMMEQEKTLQEEEEKQDIYVSTVGYEGDSSDLETDTVSDGQAYPFLDQEEKF